MQLPGRQTGYCIILHPAVFYLHIIYQHQLTCHHLPDSCLLDQPEEIYFRQEKSRLGIGQAEFTHSLRILRSTKLRINSFLLGSCIRIAYHQPCVICFSEDRTLCILQPGFFSRKIPLRYDFALLRVCSFF